MPSAYDTTLMDVQVDRFPISMYVHVYMCVFAHAHMYGGICVYIDICRGLGTIPQEMSSLFSKVSHKLRTLQVV